MSLVYRWTVGGISVDYRRYVNLYPRTVRGISVDYRLYVGGISVDCKWFVGELSVVYGVPLNHKTEHFALKKGWPSSLTGNISPRWTIAFHMEKMWWTLSWRNVQPRHCPSKMFTRNPFFLLCKCTDTGLFGLGYYLRKMVKCRFRNEI